MNFKIGLLFIFFSFLLIPQNFIYPESDNSNKSFKEFSKLFSKEDLRADHIFVIDRSGSMKKFWDEVVESTVNLIKTLPDGDYVSILGFDTKAKPLVIPRTINNESKKLLIGEIEKLRPPAGKWTDLFAALDKTLQEIKRKNGNNIKFIYFITDLINDPPSSSPYRNSYSLQRLSQRYLAITKKLDVNLIIYALQLPLSKNAGNDYQKFLGVVHGNVNRKILAKGTLSEWFKEQQQALEYKKLRAIILTKIKKKIQINHIDSDDEEVSIVLTNPYPFDIKVLNVELTSDDLGKTVNNKEIKIPSGESETIEFKTFKGLKKEKSFIRDPRNYDIDVKIEYLILPAKSVERLNISPLQVVNYDNVQMKFSSGYPLYLVILVVAGLLLLVILYLLPCVKPVRIFDGKSFRVSVSLDNEELKLTQNSFNSGSSSVDIGSQLISDFNLINDKLEEFRIQIIPFKPKFPSCFDKRRGTHIITVSNNLQFQIHYYFNGKEISRALSSSVKSSDRPLILNERFIISAEYFDKNTNNHKLEIIINEI